MLLLLLCVPCRQAPTPPLVSVMVYALPQTHSILGYCGTLSCVVCTLLSSGCWGSLCLLLLLQYVPCRHLVMTTVPSLQERACKVSATPPPPGGGLLLTSLLYALAAYAVFTGRHQPRPWLVLWFMHFRRHTAFCGYCGTLSCVVCTLLSSGCWGSLCLLLLLQYVPCRHLVMTTVPSLQERACKVSATPPPPGGGLLLTSLLCPCRVCVFTGRHQPRPWLVLWFMHFRRHTAFCGYCGTLSCVVCTLLSSGCWGSLCLLLLLQYVPCRHLVMTTVPSLQEQACKVSATPPPPGGGLLLTSLLCPCRRMRVYRQAPTPPLVSVMVYALPQTHSILGYCGTLSCVVCTLLSSGCWGSLCLLLLLQYKKSYMYACMMFWQGKAE